MRFRRDPDGAVPEIDVAPGDEPPLGIPEAGHQVELVARELGRRAGIEEPRELIVDCNIRAKPREIRSAVYTHVSPLASHGP